METHKIIAHRAVVLLAGSVAFLVAMSGCTSLRHGGSSGVIRSDSQQRVGTLTLQIIDCASGVVVSQGTREVLARDVAISQRLALDGSVCFDKRIDLDHGFYIQMAECAATTREGIGGFSLTPGRTGYRSSWEWFNADRDSHAAKLQESGELEFIPVAVGSSWEVGRIEVQKEVSLRVFGWDPTAQFRNAPRWRIQLKAGSYIEWPSLGDGVVVLHSFPVPSPTQQLVAGPERR